MEKIKKFLKDETQGWEKWEVFWLVFANLVILGVSLYMGDTVIGIIASLTGTRCVILCGKGKISTYLFGTINVLLYAIVAFQAKYYGDVMLNLLYYFPTNILGWFVWKNHMDDNNEVDKRRMTAKQNILVITASIAGILGYAYVLKLLNGNLPIVDSMSTVLSVVAQILMIKRFTEQWLIWILVDVVSVIMWFAAFFNGGESVAVFLMWVVYLINAVIMFVKWYKDSKNTVQITVKERQ